MICGKLVKPSNRFLNFKKKEILIMKLQETLLAQIAPEKEISVAYVYHDIFEVVTSLRCFCASGE